MKYPFIVITTIMIIYGTLQNGLAVSDVRHWTHNLFTNRNFRIPVSILHAQQRVWTNQTVASVTREGKLAPESDVISVHVTVLQFRKLWAGDWRADRKRLRPRAVFLAEEGAGAGHHVT